MKNNDIIKVLYELTQLDIDAVSAYEQALKHIIEDDIYDRIIDFMNDHIRHVEVLSKEISKYNGKPPEEPNLKGLLIEIFTALRSVTSTKGALKAMENNEILTNKTYKDILDKNTDIPIETKELIQHNYLDEKKHLEYIKLTLANLNKLQM